MTILPLDEFRSSPDAQFSKGTWVVEYFDRTHLRTGNYLSLGKIDIEERTPNGQHLFRFYPRCIKKLKKCICNAWKNGTGKGDPKKAAEIILDQLSESMVRLGLLQPNFEISDCKSINERNFAVVVLDTNALRDSAVRHLKEQFPNTQMWIIIPTVTLMEIGEKVANLSSRDREGFKKNNNIIRGRPQVTIAPQELKCIRQYFPTETLELAPELLRTFRGYEPKNTSTDKEPDRSSINDRLILEGIKDLRRQRNLSEGVYLMSGDKDMSRLARLEGIQTIYPNMPNIQEYSKGLYSIRYSLESRRYIVCSIHRFLWDLTHVFSKIRVRKCTDKSEEFEKLELFYYYPTKLVNDWVEDKLEVTISRGSSFTA
jgi:hypothetical protein